MSIARHHAEWLSLVPVSGPFLSLPVLMEAFPQGLDAHDAEHARLLRLAYEEWDDSFQKSKVDPSVHEAWIKFVLTKTLEFDEGLLAEGQVIPQTLQVEVPEHGELLKPNIVLNDPATKKARVLVRTHARSQDLTSYVAESRWKASPDTRMTELLHATGVRLGLVTNGEHWMLVDARKGETTGYASWYASLWREEKITLQAFRSLLSMTRLFGVADDQTLEALLTKSASNQQEVTDQLGAQVRRAVEVLIQSLDRADQDHGRELLEGVTEAVLYESALTVMMRLVFLFCAEERELIPTKPFPVYEQNYSVSTISKQLREIADQHGEELLERRYDAWTRLLSSFRAVYGGLAHDDVYMPAYGGRLFDPDRFHFLEGRKPNTSWRDTDATPLPVNNRTVLHLLEALQLIQVKVPGGGPAEARRLSFRALDIEQIGHVYEGLLDHTAKRATEATVGLIGKKEPEVPLQRLEQEREKGDKSFYEFLKKECGSSRKWENYLEVELDDRQERRLRTACGNDECMFQRVKPFAGLIRDDTFGYPLVVPKNSVFVTAGTDRRSSGTHYTPRSLTEPIVQHTLEPLVYVGPTDGRPKSEWKLKPAAELLDLKICDMACGSGAFLVQAARYMSERLMEAWDSASEQYTAAPGITPEGKPSTGERNESLIPDDPAERTIYAMRIIAQRCLFGVDINPLAAEMAKLSLWLLTLAKDKPFEFLDHAIRCGDSLVGVHDLKQLRHFSIKPDADDTALFKGLLDNSVDEAIRLRLKLEDIPSNTVMDVETQEKLLKDAEDMIARLRCAADLLVTAEFWGKGTTDKQEKVRHAAVVAGHCVESGSTEEFEGKAEKERQGQETFHWPLEFPEVIVERGGFDAFVGNPPFMGGPQLSRSYGGPAYQNWLKATNEGAFGNADLVAYFFRRCFALLNMRGALGLLATKSICEGSTRTSSLQALLAQGGVIYRTQRSVRWPGTASVTVSLVNVYASSSRYGGSVVLDDHEVASINSRLLADDETADPMRLSENENLAFIGADLRSSGFILDADEYFSLVEQDNNRDCLMPLLGGEEVNTSPTQSNLRYAINFGKRSLEEAMQYPKLLDIVRERVKPTRDRQKDHGPGKHGKKYWWQYVLRSDPLYDAISSLSRCLVTAVTTSHLAFSFQSTQQVFPHSMVVCAIETYAPFSCLQSSFHAHWALLTSSSLGGTLRYSVSDAFQTFPFPSRYLHNPQLEDVGKAYYDDRSLLMVTRQEGLTKTYNRFHDRGESSLDIQKLRDLHVLMDQAVAAAYGWDDLNLDHGYHETKQGLRFTTSEQARREVLQRLLKLNHERYTEEVKQGLHDKKRKTKKTGTLKQSKKSPPASRMLFGDDEDDEGG